VQPGDRGGVIGTVVRGVGSGLIGTVTGTVGGVVDWATHIDQVPDRVRYIGDTLWAWPENLQRGANAFVQMSDEDKIAFATSVTISAVALKGPVKAGLSRLGPTTTARLPQDLGVNPTAPRPLPLNRPVSSSPSQNLFVQNRIGDLIQQGATDIRVNQQQVNINGIRVGVNRPDLQYTLNNVRAYEEFETQSWADVLAHQPRITANDPLGQFVGWLQP
jgi:hypothetical protein